MSAKTGAAPTLMTAPASGAQPNAGTTTSSPGAVPRARSTSVSAQVPLEQATTSAAPSSGPQRLFQPLRPSPRMNRWVSLTPMAWMMRASVSRSPAK